MIGNVIQQLIHTQENLVSGEEVHCVNSIGEPQVGFSRLVCTPHFRKAPKKVCVLVELKLQILKSVFASTCREM